ncbi:integrase catalytic domain-containing protein [Trichonephila clavipes]|nr:integrase catalytic domain-containing protein [Trichonephila clavipes]
MEDLRSQQSGENPDVVFCYPMTDSSVPSLNDAVPEDRLFKYSQGGRSFATCKSRIRPQTSHLAAKKAYILTDLIVGHYHEILLHAGTQLVQSCIQEQYWIIGARDVIRHLIRKRIKCSKVRASITNQMMSDLPSSRISPAPALMRCGVDYAGPFQIKIIKGRGSKSFKAYIALFVCFTIRAIHLELVTDLPADAFIASSEEAAPEIFTGRHASIKHILDDGTTCLRPAELVIECGLGHVVSKPVVSSGYLDGGKYFLEDQTIELLEPDLEQNGLPRPEIGNEIQTTKERSRKNTRLENEDDQFRLRECGVENGEDFVPSFTALIRIVQCFFSQLTVEVDEELSVLKTKALRILLPFSTSYLFQTGFSAVDALKTKYRSQLNIEK